MNFDKFIKNELFYSLNAALSGLKLLAKISDEGAKANFFCPFKRVVSSN
jgi:hypothetical protein